MNLYELLLAVLILAVAWYFLPGIFALIITLLLILAFAARAGGGIGRAR